MSVENNDQLRSNSELDNNEGQPGGQSDWEARFKGLQREYNRLNASYKEAQQKAVELQTQKNQFELSLHETTRQYEGKLTEALSGVQSKTSEFESLSKTKAELEQQVAKLSRDREIRKELSKPENQALLPWYDSGLLNVDGREGEELQTHLNTFKSMLSTKTAADVQSMMGATTPPPIGSQPKMSGGMNQDELRQWLRDNPNHPNYKVNYAQFLDLVSEEQKRGN